MSADVRFVLPSQSSLLPAAWCDLLFWFWRPVIWQNISNCHAYLWAFATFIPCVGMFCLHRITSFNGSQCIGQTATLSTSKWNCTLFGKESLSTHSRGERVSKEIQTGSCGITFPGVNWGVGNRRTFCFMAFLSSNPDNSYMPYTSVGTWPSPAPSRRGCRETVTADSHVRPAHVRNMTECDDAAVSRQVSCTQTTSVSCETCKGNSDKLERVALI